MLENSSYKLYYDGSIITDHTTRNNSPDKFIRDKIIKEASLIDAAIPSSHQLHSTITEALQKYTGFTVQLIRKWQLKTAYIIPLVISKTSIILNTNV